jgi:hypothetical protein
MLRTLRSKLALAASLLGLLSSGLAQAALVSFTITGTISGGSLGLAGTTVTATGQFDTALLAVNPTTGAQTIEFNGNSFLSGQNSLDIVIPGYGSLTQSDDKLCARQWRVFRI